MCSAKQMQDWTNPFVVIKAVGPHLVPFFKTVAIYFVLADRESECWLTCLLKCLPIIWLCVFVVLRGVSLRPVHTYSRRILAGLCFSLIGDAFLVSSSSFMSGLASFSVAHVFYIAAFGFQPLNIPVGIACAITGSSAYYIMYPKLTGVFTVAVIMYTSLLSTMLWRSIARVQFINDKWTWTKLCAAFGGVLFTISDTLLGLQYFGLNVGLSAKQSQTIVMATYYAAQLFIALSTAENIMQPEQSKAVTPENKSCSTKKDTSKVL